MRPVASIVAAVLLTFASGGALAHHDAEGRMRIILVEQQGDHTVLYVRLPAPFLFIAEAMDRSSPNDRVEAPFLRSERNQGVWVYTLDGDAIEDDPGAFAERIAGTLAVTLEGRPAIPTVTTFTVQSAESLPAFSVPEEARAALAARLEGPDPFVGLAFIDARLEIEGTGPLTIESTVNERAVPPQIYIESTFIDFRTDPAQRIDLLGALERAVVLEGS